MKNFLFLILGGLSLLSSAAYSATCDSLNVCGADVQVTTYKDAPIVIGFGGELVIDENNNAISLDVFDNNDVNKGLVTQPNLNNILTNRTFTFDPNGDFDELMEGETGTATFSYYLSRSNGGGQITGTVTINVKGEEIADLDGENCQNLICANAVSVETHKSQSIVIGDDAGEELSFNYTGNDDAEGISLFLVPEKGTTSVNDQNQIVFSPDGQYSNIPEGEVQIVRIAYNIYSDNAFLSSPVNGMGEVLISITGSGEVSPFTILSDKEIPSEDEIIRPFSATIAIAMTANKNYSVDELIAKIELDPELQVLDTFVIKNYVEDQALEDYDLTTTDYEISENAEGTFLEFDVPEMNIGDTIVVIVELTTLTLSKKYNRYDITVYQKSTLEEIQSAFGPAIGNDPYNTSSISLLVALFFTTLFGLYILRKKQYKSE